MNANHLNIWFDASSDVTGRLFKEIPVDCPQLAIHLNPSSASEFIG